MVNLVDSSSPKRITVEPCLVPKHFFRNGRISLGKMYPFEKRPDSLCTLYLKQICVFSETPTLTHINKLTEKNQSVLQNEHKVLIIDECG
jgi:hypothetical protein